MRTSNPPHDAAARPAGLLRHLLSVFLLPFMVVAVVPSWMLGWGAAIDSWWIDGSAAALTGRLVGGALWVCGLSLFVGCVRLFASVGRGTLAPWDPTQRLVAVGPYRFVRNPMISSVATMLAGEVLLLGSQRLAGWLGAFALINHVFFLFVEEPGLERRFGERYVEYKRHVPRWIPRLRPWEG